MTDEEMLQSGPLCKDCHKEHYDQVCPCNKCGWIHPHHGCLDRPLTPEEIPTVAKAMNAAIKTLNQRASMNNEQVVRVRAHLLHVSKTSLKDIQEDRKMLYHMDEDLDRIYKSVGILQM